MKTFSTVDINLATTLMTLGFEFEGLDKSDPKIKFLFKIRDQSIADCAQAYWQRSLQVEPQAWALNFRALKNMLHQE